MNKECEIVRDLLPLYAENMASRGSRELIESHLPGCNSCHEELLRMKETIPIAPETDTQPLRSLRSGLRTRVVSAVLLAIMLLLTVFAGVLVCGLVPVWMTCEDAVIAVEQMDDGRIRVKASDDVYGTNSYNNSICFETLRLDWFVNATVKELRKDSEHYFYFQLEEGESLWYCGEQTGTQDVLLWGDGQKISQSLMEYRGDKTLVYLFWISICFGMITLLAGCIFRKRLCGKLLMWLSVPALCCALSCLFVTDGHLLTQKIFGASVRFNRLPQQLIATAVMTALSSLSVCLTWLTVSSYKK